MSEIKVNKISPATGTDITLGDSGDTFTVPSGGTIVNSGTATGFGGAAGLVLLKTLTSDGSDSTLSFVHGADDVVIDTTYNHHLIVFSEIHAQTSAADFTFQCSTDGGSNYNLTTQSMRWRTYHNESGSDNQSPENGSGAQSADANFQILGESAGVEAQDQTSGDIHLFGLASTTYDKMFMARNIECRTTDYVMKSYVDGYFKTASAINAIQFKYDSGEIQGGTISLYGVTK